MRTLLIFIFSSLFLVDVKAQTSSVADLVTRMNKLDSINKQISWQNQQLQRKMYLEDSLEYASSFNSMALAIENADVLENKFQTAMDAINKDPVFVRLMEANNPTSDVLGFKFTDVILEASTKAFSEKLDGEEEKKRWTNNVNSLINKDIVSVLLQSNTLTAVASSIVTSAAGFTRSTIKNKNIIEEQVFNAEEMKTFIKSMQPYIEFYEKLTVTGNKYLNEVSRIKDKYSHLSASASQFNQKLLKTLGINDSNNVASTTQLQELYKPTVVNGVTQYSLVLKQDKIVAATKHIYDFKELQEEVQRLQTDYDLALIGFLKEYNNNLGSSKTLTKGIDATKVDALIKDTDNLIKSLESK